MRSACKLGRWNNEGWEKMRTVDGKACTALMGSDHTYLLGINLAPGSSETAVILF